MSITTLRAGKIVPGLAEVAFQVAEVRGVDYQVVVEVRRRHSALSKVGLDDVIVCDVDNVIGLWIDIATPLNTKLLRS